MVEERTGPPERARAMHEVLAERVREYRRRRGWSQQDLANEMAKLGYRINRVTLAKLEAGGTRAENASLLEVLVVAAALDVPPPLLLLPLGDDVDVHLTPAVRLDPALAYLWWCGEESFARRDDAGHAVAKNPEAWFGAAEPIRLYRELLRLQEEVGRGERRMLADPDDHEPLDLALRALFQHRRHMRSAGVAPLWVPEEWLDRARVVGIVEDDPRPPHPSTERRQP